MNMHNLDQAYFNMVPLDDKLRWGVFFFFVVKEVKSRHGKSFLRLVNSNLKKRRFLRVTNNEELMASQTGTRIVKN